jgi:hypothetical protein
MILDLRAEEVEARIIPWTERVAERTVAFAMGHERLWRWGTRLGRLLQKPFANDGQIDLPEQLNPMRERKLPALAPRSFREMWRDGDFDAD